MAETVRIEIPIEAEDKTAKGTQSAKKNFENLEKEVSKFDKSAQKTEKNLKSWISKKWQLVLEAKDRISPVVEKLGSGLKGIFGKAWNLTMKVADFVTAPIRGIINLLKNPVLQAASVLGITIGFKDTVDTYKNFEAAMSQVQAISGASTEDAKILTEKAKEMGATTKFTAEESAEAFKYMAMAGWKTESMIGGIKGILNLAAASGEDLGTTSDIVTDALTAFKMKADDAEHFSDVLAIASSNANTNVSMMGETFKYAGAMAGTLGYSIEDVALATGLMANSGIKSSMAGTSLNQIMTRLSTNTAKARTAIEELGVAFFDEEHNARPLRDVLGELREKTRGFNDEQMAALGKTVAGTTAQKGLLSILNASEEDWKKLAEAVDNADGASQKMADTMLDNLSGSLTLLNSAIDGVKINLGSRFAPYIRDLADWITKKMPEIDSGITKFMDGFDRKAEEFKKKFSEITSSEEFQNADLFGKTKILWDELIGKPFKEWWDSKAEPWWNNTAMPWLTAKAEAAGETIGSVLSQGLLILLGLDPSGAVEDGKTIGGSFIKGFKEGFKTDEISEALKEWASDHKGLIAAAGALAGAKIAMGIASAIGTIKIAFGTGGITATAAGAAGAAGAGAAGTAGAGATVAGAAGATGAGLALGGAAAVAGAVAANAYAAKKEIDYANNLQATDPAAYEAYQQKWTDAHNKQMERRGGKSQAQMQAESASRTKGTHRANGGLVNAPQYSLVGEAGSEMIIPLSSSRRARGLDLFERAGEMLGVGNNAAGGYREARRGNVSVAVSMNPSFTISGGSDEETIVDVVKKHIREMADEIGGEIAERLMTVYENMPAGGNA